MSRPLEKIENEVDDARQKLRALLAERDRHPDILTNTSPQLQKFLIVVYVMCLVSLPLVIGGHYWNEQCERAAEACRPIYFMNSVCYTFFAVNGAPCTNEQGHNGTCNGEGVCVL